MGEALGPSTRLGGAHELVGFRVLQCVVVMVARYLAMSGLDNVFGYHQE